MAELLSAGVFVEEVPAATQVIGPVSTSTMGIVCWTPEGPTNTATLVTSFDQFVKTFGTFDRRSYGAYSMAAFFTNGGRRAYVVRVTPGDAVASSCKIQSKTTAQTIETGDGVTTAFTKTASTSLLKDNSGASPVVPASLTISWRGKNTTQTTAPTKKRDGTTALTTSTGVLSYEGRLNPSTLTTVDPDLLAVVPNATAAIQWTSSAAGKSISIANPPAGSTVGTGTNGAGSTAKLDFRTGAFSLLIIIAETPDNATAVTSTYDPTTPTKTVTDDGAGVLPAGAVLSGAGSVTYATGAYSFTTLGTTNIPHANGPILATYKINAWTLAPISKGVWGNSISLDVSGSPNYYTAATNTFSRYDFTVYRTDSNGTKAIVELYEELVFTDTTSIFYFADIVNEASHTLRITTPAGNEAPGELNGLNRTYALAGGSDNDTARLIQTTLISGPVAPRSLTITYTSSDGATRTIKDDGKGNLTGDIDPAYTGGAANTLVYTSGAIDFKTVPIAGPLGIKAGTLVLATYRSAALETDHLESFGDQTSGKVYTLGTDGTFDSTNFGRGVFTSPTLSPSYQGLYALDRIDELMQIIVPDFAGDITVTGDLLDYAASHSNAPSGGDRFIILTVPKGSSATDSVDWFRTKLGRFSDFAALYWPWVNVADPLANGRKLTMPVLGHVAGIYARTDVNRNVGKAPGGTVDGALSFLTGLEMIPTQGERDVVYPNKINPLISSPQTGLAVWGVRTISLQSQWKYINARRLFMFLEKSIFNATFWIVFENNGPGLWARIKAQLNSFLLGLFNDGYFAGTSPDQAFFVTVDDTNNTESTIDAGEVIVDIGVAPGKPAEFVRFRFAQKTLT